MSIREIGQKIKGVATFIEKTEIYLVLLMILVALGSFFLGRLSVFDERVVPVTIESLPTENPRVLGASTEVVDPKIESTPKTETSERAVSQGTYVGSKNGTKFHLPWCSGALRIAEANKVWFQTKEEAVAKGYTPAANCKGI